MGVRETVIRENAKKQRMRITVSKNLPHREHSPPADASSSRPRAALCQGSRPLTGRRRPWSSVPRLAGDGDGAPAASLSLFGGRGAATGQRPRCLGLSLATRLWCRERLGARGDPARCGRGRGVSAGTVRSAWPFFWRSRPRDVDVASRRTLEDLVEARRHPLGVVAVVIAVSAVILTGGFFFRLPPLPGLGSTCLQLLAVEILLLLLFLLRVLGGLLFLSRLAPFVTVDPVLLYWRPVRTKTSFKKRGNPESKPYTRKERTRSIEPASSLMGKPLTCSGWKSPATAALTRAATSSSAGALLDTRHASRSRDETPGPISSILSG